MICPHRPARRPVRTARARAGEQTSRAVPARGHRPRAAGLPRRHDRPGKGGGVGCRHAHGLDIVWSARHGVNTPDMLEFAGAFGPRSSVVEPAVPTAEVQRIVRAAEELTAATAPIVWEGPHAERELQVRLGVLYAFLALGLVLVLGAGIALAAALRIGPGIWGTVLAAGATVLGVMAYRTRRARRPAAPTPRGLFRGAPRTACPTRP